MSNNTNNIDIDIHDRVAEAYYGELGEKLMKETQHRMHWIRDNVAGNNILDIGCSQGIGPILLGRLGKKVTGVDISQKAVDEANEALEKEAQSVKEKVNFKKSDFLAYDANEVQFDTITITEVLEHLVNPEEFIGKAKELLVDNGTLIVTVPFGINDHIDHKKTYYFLDLYQMLYKDFDIKEVSILGKWIGFIAHPREQSREDTLTHINIDFLTKTEEGFYVAERDLVDRYNLLYTNLNEANSKYKNATTQLETLKQKLEKTTNELQEHKNSMLCKIGHTVKYKIHSTNDILQLIKKLTSKNEIKKIVKKKP